MNVLEVPLDKLTSNPWQTRQAGDQAYIKELALDIAANGLLQIPVGRALNSDGAPAALWGEDNQARLLDLEHRTVQLAFGHNRLAAYRWLANAGLSDKGNWSTMPVEIRALDDEQMAALAWSENEKRRDHTPVERARAIQARIEHFGWTHEETAERLGISRSVVTNTLRLLKLPEQLQEDLQKGTISERQGLALIALYDIDETAAHSHDFEFTRQVIIGWAREGWSSEKIRERVNDALKMLREQIQPELTAPQGEIEQAPVQTGSPEHEPPAARGIEAEAEPRRGENQREDLESAEIKPDKEQEGEKPRNAAAKTPQTAPPPPPGERLGQEQVYHEAGGVGWNTNKLNAHIAGRSTYWNLTGSKRSRNTKWWNVSNAGKRIWFRSSTSRCSAFLRKRRRNDIGCSLHRCASDRNASAIGLSLAGARDQESSGRRRDSFRRICEN